MDKEHYAYPCFSPKILVALHYPHNILLVLTSHPLGLILLLIVAAKKKLLFVERVRRKHVLLFCSKARITWCATHDV